MDEKEQTELILEKINYEVSDFVYKHLYDNGEPNLKKIDYTRSVTKILLENIPNITEYEYKKVEPLKNSIEYAFLFLGSLDDSYGAYFHKRLTDGTIHFCKLDYAIENDIPDTSFSSYEDGERIISLIYEENIGDVYSIIHEIFHDMNLIVDIDDPKYNPMTRDMFTEMVSFLATNLAKEYFETKFPEKKEFKYDITDEYYGLYHKTMQIDFLIKAIDVYLNNGYISEQHLIEILENKSDFYVGTVVDCIEQLDSFEDLDIYFNERYLTGALLTQYVLNTNSKYEDKVQVLKDLNEMIMTYPAERIFDYLDIEYIVEDDYLMNLSPESLEKIEKSYKLGTKNL